MLSWKLYFFLQNFLQHQVRKRLLQLQTEKKKLFFLFHYMWASVYFWVEESSGSEWRDVYWGIRNVFVKHKDNTKKIRRFVKWQDRFQGLTGRCWHTESCRVHTRQRGKIKTAELRHRLNYAPGLHNTQLTSFMLLCNWLGAQPSCRLKSSKGSQEYLNRAFWKLKRLLEYRLQTLLRLLWKLFMPTMYKFLCCILAYKCL